MTITRYAWNECACFSVALFAGVSLRKKPPADGTRGHLVMPLASAFVRAAERRAFRSSTDAGRNSYRLCHLAVLGEQRVMASTSVDFSGTVKLNLKPSFQEQFAGLRLYDHVAAFHASRAWRNGFEMTPRLEKMYPEVSLARIDQVLPLLQPADRVALRASLAFAHSPFASNVAESLAALPSETPTRATPPVASAPAPTAAIATEVEPEFGPGKDFPKFDSRFAGAQSAPKFVQNLLSWARSTAQLSQIITQESPPNHQRVRGS